MTVTVKFWGVRGSVPAPLTSADVEKKVRFALEQYEEELERTMNVIPSHPLPEIKKFLKTPFTYGGNTSCVEIRHGDNIYVLDMGTGLRPFGNALFPEIFAAKKAGKTVTINFITSHVHWDHIQGLPFFGPLYLSKENDFDHAWNFFGGTEWQRTVETCLRGQMDPPTFPVSWKEIEQITRQMKFTSVHDGLSLGMGNVSPFDIMRFKKLHHPQETYGVRFEFPGGPVIAYTTDNEPFDPFVPDQPLIELAKGADIWITDCQYTRGQYNGDPKEGGVPRHGWGHSYPEAVATTALMAGVEHVVLFHHDPASSDERISEIRAYTEQLIRDGGGAQRVTAAWEGLEIAL